VGGREDQQAGLREGNENRVRLYRSGSSLPSRQGQLGQSKGKAQGKDEEEKQRKREGGSRELVADRGSRSSGVFMPREEKSSGGEKGRTDRAVESLFCQARR